MKLSDYEESARAKKLREELENQQKPAAFASGWKGVVDAALERLRDRKDFSYDAAGDALYRQYKDRYLRGGRQAMTDTAASAAARTGGYGNSYAQTAGQQAYGSYMAGLADRIPELYQLALNRYTAQGEELYRQYELAAGQEQAEYDRYRDTVADWQDRQKYLQDAYTDARDFDRTQNRDTVADEKWLQELEEEKRQFDTRYGGKGGSGGSSGGAAEKTEEKSGFDALAAWCRDQKINGATRDAIRARISQAYLGGEISQAEMLQLIAWYTVSPGTAGGDKESQGSGKFHQNYVR